MKTGRALYSLFPKRSRLITRWKEYQENKSKLKKNIVSHVQHKDKAHVSQRAEEKKGLRRKDADRVHAQWWGREVTPTVTPSVWTGRSMCAAADPVRKHKRNFLHGTD